MKKFLFLVLALSLVGLIVGCGGGSSNSSADPVAVTFVVTVPAGTPAEDTIYIVGDFNEWDPGDAACALTKNDDGTYQITLTKTAGTVIGYKFTRGSWDVVEKQADGVTEVDNRPCTFDADKTIEITIEAWDDLGADLGD